MVRTTTLFEVNIDLTLFDRAGDVIGTRNDKMTFGRKQDAIDYMMDDVLEFARNCASAGYLCYWSMKQYRVDTDGNMELVREWGKRRAV